jgi:hypothetical protein
VFLNLFSSDNSPTPKIFFAALKTPPAFHEQRQKLERAKTGDLLKAKIQQRPDRQELVRQHILEGKNFKKIPFRFELN